MDLLQSLNVIDLPEQQTRTSHLVAANPNFELTLGFDACCTCGSSLENAPVTFNCRACQRVSYCSEACREIDSNLISNAYDTSAIDDPDIEPDNALGHTSVICSLLNLCNDDEAIDNGEGGALNHVSREAAINRVKSEYESYPATLANVILDGPCFQEILNRLNRQALTIHVIGASENAELSCGPTGAITNSASAHAAVCKDYAEALAELANRCKVQTIELLFIGPECPHTPWDESLPMQYIDKAVGHLHIRSMRSIYNKESLENEAKADFVVMFNPGLTCPDYPNWNETLHCIPNGTPFLLTTNTEMEGIADCQFLLDQDKIQSLPPVIAEIFGVAVETNDDDLDDNENDTTSFFFVNPFCGSRVRQNGTMANDLFVKNRWVLGGFMNSFDPSSKVEPAAASKKIKTGGNDTNTKANNPALI